VTEKIDLDDIDELLQRFDHCYSEGMDHEQGFDFAMSMVDKLQSLATELRAAREVIEAAKTVTLALTANELPTSWLHETVAGYNKL
jgi:hypothetical protein